MNKVVTLGKGKNRWVLGLAGGVLISANAAFGQSVLPSHLQQSISDVVDLRNSSVQFLQGAGRWFPAPAGDDAKFARNLQELHDRLQGFKTDLDNGESIQTLRSDMNKVNESSASVETFVPVLGGNAETAQDWSRLQSDLPQVRQDFAVMEAHSQGNARDDAQAKPTIPELAQQLLSAIPPYKKSLGQFLNMPTRVPPSQNQDLSLVQMLKLFEDQSGQFVQEVGSGRSLSIIQEESKQLKYTAGKMEDLMDAIGPDEPTAQAWQQLRSSVDEIYAEIGNASEGSGADYFMPDAKQPPPAVVGPAIQSPGASPGASGGSGF